MSSCAVKTHNVSDCSALQRTQKVWNIKTTTFPIVVPENWTRLRQKKKKTFALEPVRSKATA